MRYKAFGQRTILDEWLLGKGKRPKAGFLEQVDTYVDWGIFRKPLERSFQESPFGPRRYDVLVLFKMVMLQQWYDLSDPEIEEQVSDRLSFRRFLGLTVTDEVADETTICKFRNHLLETGLYDWLFETLQTELTKRHLVVKRGALVDATFIAAPRKDPDAKYGHKGHGYSVHTHVDQGSEIIREYEVTSAEVHDSQPFEDLLFGDEKSAFADKAYFNDQTKRMMREEGIYCGILDKAKRNHPLSNRQKKRNRQKSSVRQAVEHPFAQMKEHQNYRRSRYRGLEKNRCHAALEIMAYNLKRMIYLLKQQAKAVVQEMKARLDPLDTRTYCA